MNVSSLTPGLSDFHKVQFFYQLLLFFVFKLVFILLLVVEGSEAYLPTPPSWPEVPVILSGISYYLFNPWTCQKVAMACVIG